MADEGWARDYAELVDPLVEQLRGAASPAEAQAILSAQADLAEVTAFAERLARAGFALRIDALTDAGGEG